MARCLEETVSTVYSTRLLQEAYTVVEKLDGFVVAKCEADGDQCLVIHHKQLYNHPPFGMISRCRIIIKHNEYSVHILMRKVESGCVTTTDAVLKLCSKYSTNSSVYKFCPGLEMSEYEHYKEIIRFDIKSVRLTTEPFARVDSVLCLLWFELGKRASAARREAESILCQHCVRLRCYLESQAKRTQAESPSKKVSRQLPSSNARLSYMSPDSQMKRKKQQRIQHDECRRKICKYEHTDITLDSEQHEEMCNVVSMIERNCSDELEELIMEGMNYNMTIRNYL